ncbi:MAG: glutaredoxin family protein [Chloroflexi bacterium]|nr:glutaredoxin family protein [Chloroflexota bacterium]
MTEVKGNVPGSRQEHTIRFYGLSTCVWCKKTRQFLEDHDVAFEFTYVDLLSGAERDEIRALVRRWNPRESFPTIVIDEEQCIVGYRPEELKEALGL